MGTSVLPVEKEEYTLHLSEELAERNNNYGTCDVDATEAVDAVADVYEEYETLSATKINEVGCSPLIHLAAEVDINEPFETGVEAESVRTSRSETFEEHFPGASSTHVLETSLCCVAAELSLRESEVHPVREEVKVGELSEEEHESVEKIAVRGIPECTDSTVCITTETTFHHKTEFVQKRAPSIEIELPKEAQEADEANYRVILMNGHCTSAHISHDVEDKIAEEITESEKESAYADVSIELEEHVALVTEVSPDRVTPLNVSVELEQEEHKEVLSEDEEYPSEKEFVEDYGMEEIFHISHTPVIFSSPSHETRETSMDIQYTETYVEDESVVTEHVKVIEDEEMSVINTIHEKQPSLAFIADDEKDEVVPEDYQEEPESLVKESADELEISYSVSESVKEASSFFLQESKAQQEEQSKTAKEIEEKYIEVTTKTKVETSPLIIVGEKLEKESNMIVEKSEENESCVSAETIEENDVSLHKTIVQEEQLETELQSTNFEEVAEEEKRQQKCIDEIVETEKDVDVMPVYFVIQESEKISIANDAPLQTIEEPEVEKDEQVEEMKENQVGQLEAEEPEVEDVEQVEKVEEEKVEQVGQLEDKEPEVEKVEEVDEEKEEQVEQFADEGPEIEEVEEFEEQKEEQVEQLIDEGPEIEEVEEFEEQKEEQVEQLIDEGPEIEEVEEFEEQKEEQVEQFADEGPEIEEVEEFEEQKEEQVEQLIDEGPEIEEVEEFEEQKEEQVEQLIDEGPEIEEVEEFEEQKEEQVEQLIDEGPEIEEVEEFEEQKEEQVEQLIDEGPEIEEVEEFEEQKEEQVEQLIDEGPEIEEVEEFEEQKEEQVEQLENGEPEIEEVGQVEEVDEEKEEHVEQLEDEEPEIEEVQQVEEEEEEEGRAS